MIVTGCLVQRYKDELIKEIPEVDLFVSIREYDDIWNNISNLIEGKNQNISVEKRFISFKISLLLYPLLKIY